MLCHPSPSQIQSSQVKKFVSTTAPAFFKASFDLGTFRPKKDSSRRSSTYVRSPSPSEKLNIDNYQARSIQMERALDANNKLGFIDCTLDTLTSRKRQESPHIEKVQQSCNGVASVQHGTYNLKSLYQLEASLHIMGHPEGKVRSNK